MILLLSTLFFALTYRSQSVNLSSEIVEKQTRLDDISSAAKLISKNLSKLKFTECNKGKIYTDSILGLRIDTTNKSISFDQLKKIAKLKSTQKISDIYIDTTTLESDFLFLGSLKIDTKNQVFKASISSESKASTFDFFALVEDNNLPKCILKIRLHFAEEAFQLQKAGYIITSSIGRSGHNIGRFSLPYGTQFHNGILWSTDCSNENVSKFTLDGQFLGSFGNFGTRLGELDTPADLQIVNNHIFVVEERNNRVQKFSLEGEPLEVFGAYAKTTDPYQDTNKFNGPIGIAWDGKNLAIVDMNNNRIIGVDPADGYKTVWVSGNKKQNNKIIWNLPYYIHWSNTGKYFVVSNRDSNEIVLMDSTGNKLTSIGKNILSYPHEIDTNDEGDIYVSDMNNRRVVIFEKEYEFDEKFAKYIEFPESYGVPKTMTVLDSGRFVVGLVGNGTANFLLVEPIDAVKLNLNTNKNRIYENYKNKVPFSSLGSNYNSNNTEIQQTYTTHCSGCHENGNYDAPARRNIESWEHFSRDLDELLKLTKIGKGAMTPNGGCSACSDEILIKTIKYMLPMNWQIK